MSEKNPYQQLGVAENASFEEIQAAKQRLSQQYQNDSQTLESIEAAYDAIIMNRLRLRKEGRIKVPDRIRFPERSSEPSPNSAVAPTKSPPSWLKNLLDTPSQQEILWPSIVFFGLAMGTVFSQRGDASFLALLMGLGGLASVYFLNRKEKRFGRAVLITLIALILGVSLGSVLSWLLVSSPVFFISLGREQLACLLTLCLFWLSSSFLR